MNTTELHISTAAVFYSVKMVADLFLSYLLAKN